VIGSEGARALDVLQDVDVDDLEAFHVARAVHVCQYLGTFAANLDCGSGGASPTR